MNQPKISIIVPVYKAEPYLKRCIESVLTQDYPQYELILIDDGSPDNSGMLCDEYAKKDSRITVIHKKNEGVSAARNDGIEIAQGDYILFIDADDALEERTLSGNIKYMESGIDLIEYPAIYNYQDTSERKSGHAYCHIQGRKQCMNYICSCNRYEVWSFFIRRKTIQDLRFKPHIKIGEDIIFLYELASSIKNIIVSEQGNYYHYKNNDSAMNSLSSAEKDVTKAMLFAELFQATVKYQQVAIGYSYPYFHRLYRGEIENPILKIQLKRLIKEISIRSIIQSPIPFKSKILLIIMHFLRIERKS